MAENHLTMKDTELVAFVQNNGIGEIIKPLIREIHLFDSYVAGTSYLKDPSVLEELHPGDRLLLQREENRFDSNAILLYDEKTKKKAGYVPEGDNVIFARLLDAGKLLSAYVKEINHRGSFTQISIGIHLVDF